MEGGRVVGGEEWCWSMGVGGQDSISLVRHLGMREMGISTA